MADSKDELFCRLAIRLGLLTREDGIQIIKSYRSDAKVGQGIGAFVVEEGWLEPEDVRAINEKIAARAPGHVSTSRKRVPNPGGGKSGKDGKRPVRHRKHVAAYPDKVNANPLQIATVGVGAVILIASLVFLIIQFQQSDSKAPADQIKQKVADREQATQDQLERAKEERAKKQKEQEKAVAEPQGPVDLSSIPAEELKRLKGSIRDHVFAAQQMTEFKPYQAQEFLEKKLDELKNVPTELTEGMSDYLTTVRGLVKAKYEEEFLEQLQNANASDDQDEINGILADIKEACGPEYHAQAKKEVE